MGYHILIIPGLRPNYKYKTHGSFVQSQAEALSSAGNFVGMIHIGLRSVFSVREGHIKGYTFQKLKYIEVNNVHELRYQGWFIGGLSKLREKHYSRIAKRLFNKYIDKYGMPDLIHAHFSIWSGVIAYHLYKTFNVPYVITEHSSSYGRGMVKNKYLNLLTNVLENAQQIVCVSQGLSNDISNYTSRKIQVIGNIVDTNFFVPHKQTKVNPVFRIFTLGYLTKVKGIDLLIKSVSELIRKNNKQLDVKLIVGGNGPERENLMELVRINGLEGNVEFLGELKRNEVKKQLQLCDIFALPSRFETFGVALVEAMSMGKPVIAAKTHGPKEFVSKKVGYLINIENIKDLVNSIDDAIVSRKSWKTKSSIIRNYAIDNFSEKVFLAKTSSLYDKAVSETNDSQ